MAGPIDCAWSKGAKLLNKLSLIYNLLEAKAGERQRSALSSRTEGETVETVITYLAHLSLLQRSGMFIG